MLGRQQAMLPAVVVGLRLGNNYLGDVRRGVHSLALALGSVRLTTFTSLWAGSRGWCSAIDSC